MGAYCIVETGGKQYKIKEGDSIIVEKVDASKKDKSVNLEKVLLYTDGKAVNVGKPYIKGAKVECELISELKGEKIIIFKFRRRKSSKRKIGHRQKYCKLLVKKIKI